MSDPEAVYRRTPPASRALHERAVKAMPGGTTRTTTYFDPYPLYIDRGEGCRIWDADGAERIDMLGNYTASCSGRFVVDRSYVPASKPDNRPPSRINSTCAHG